MRSDILPFLFVVGASPAAAFSWLPAPFVKSSERSIWIPPKETDAAVEGNVDLRRGVSPRPTPVPRPLFGRMKLEPRLDGFTMGDNTCGFIATEWNDPFTCVRVSATCTNDGPYVGCCEAGQECTIIKKTCIGYTASLTGACDLPTDFHTVCCSTSLFPECHTYLFSTTATPGSTFTLFNCDRAPGIDTLLDYPPEFTRSTAPVTNSRTSTTESSTTTTTTTAETTTSTTSTPTPPPSEGGGTNVGAIAGGTVGGIAALGAIGLLIFFFALKGKKGPDSPGSTAAMAQPPPTSSPPAMLQAQPTGQSSAAPSGAYPYSPGGFQQPGWNPQTGAYDQGAANGGYQPPPPQPYQPYPDYGQQPHPQQFSPTAPPQQGAIAQQQAFQGYPPQTLPGGVSPPSGASPVHEQAVQAPVAGAAPLPNKAPEYAGYYVPNQPAPAMELDTTAPVGLPANRAELT